jgi:NNP family nitrate/nitrite transporter-like MFS transporter
MPLVCLKREAHSGSPLTVFASFLHFDMCYIIWVMLGALSVSISQSLHLNPAQQGWMVAIPTLSGSLFRFPIGLLGDRFSTKRVGVGMLLFLFLPLLLGWLIPVNFPALLGIGLMLGVAGASFAVALSLASRWYPPSRQGVVMGIVTAGNSGTVIINVAAPQLASICGWHAVLGMTMIPLAVILVVFSLIAKESPMKPKSIPLSGFLQALAKTDLWWFCLLYSATAGSSVGLSTFLPQFFHNQYDLNALTAGYLTAVATLMGSLLRPLGGYIADTFGGVRTLTGVFVSVFALYAFISLLLPIGLTVTLFIIGMVLLGLGNSAVFQLVPQCFGTEMGVATGLVGAFGGIGGFLVPIVMGYVKLNLHSYALGWIVLAGFMLLALVVLRILATHRGWRTSWATVRETELAPMAVGLPQLRSPAQKGDVFRFDLVTARERPEAMEHPTSSSRHVEDLS